MNVTLKHYKTFHKWVRYPNNIYDIGFFANVVPDGENYIGAVRLGDAQLNDQIGIVRYDSDLNLIDCESVTKGEDPRTFMYNGEPYSLTWDPFWDPNNVGSILYLKYKLVNLLTKHVINLNINGITEAPISKLGKNWMPLVKDGDLYIVLQIDPVVNVVKCDLTTGLCVWVPPSDFKDSIDVTPSRGGTPFIYSEKHNKYIGLGHRTYTSFYHNPYLYTITPDFSTVHIGEDINTGRQHVQDPHSIFIKDDKIFCCIGNWDVPNSGHVDMYEVQIDE